MGFLKKITGLFFILMFIVLFKTFLYKILGTGIKPQNSSYPVVYVDTREHNEIDKMFTDLADSGKCSNTSLNTLTDSVYITFYFPCAWKEYKENSTIPTLIKQYTITLSDSCLVGLSVDISASPTTLTPKVIKRIRNAEVLKNLTKSSGDFISFQPLEINGIKSDEVLIKKITNNPESFTFKLFTHFYYDNRIITFTYLVVSKNQLHASTIFQQYKSLFREMAKKTQMSKI